MTAQALLDAVHSEAARTTTRVHVLINGVLFLWFGQDLPLRDVLGASVTVTPRANAMALPPYVFRKFALTLFVGASFLEFELRPDLEFRCSVSATVVNINLCTGKWFDPVLCLREDTRAATSGFDDECYLWPIFCRQVRASCPHCGPYRGDCLCYAVYLANWLSEERTILDTVDVICTLTLASTFDGRYQGNPVLSRARFNMKNILLS